MLGGLEHKTLAAVVARALRVAAASASGSAGLLLTVNPSPGQDIGALVNSTIDSLLVVSPNGGTIRIPDGAYFVETSILQKSGIHLALNPGTTLTAKTGLNNPVIKNATAVTEKTITNMTNAARVATATCVAHGYAVGDWVHISGATPEGYNGWHKVITVPTVDTFTYYVDKNIAADSGTIKVFKAVESNLKITGGKILGNALNTVSGNDHGVHYNGVRDFVIYDLWVDGTYNTPIFIESGVRGKLFRARGDNAIHASYNGILLGASSTLRYVDDAELIACEAHGNGQDGLIVERGHGVRLVACGGTYNGLSAIKIAKPSNVVADACWGKHNTGSGIQVQGAGGNNTITITNGIYIENGDAGILVGNTDTATPMRNITIKGNQCHRNGQVAAPTFAYGIAIEATFAATIDRLVVDGNQCDEQARGLSFGVSGTVSNTRIANNTCRGNTADIVLGASLQTTTLTLGVNYGIGASSHDAAYGQNVRRLDFSAENIPASSGVVVCTKPGPARGYVMPKPGYVKMIYGISNAAVTAGTLTITVRKNGVFLNNMSWTAGTTKSIEMDAQVYPFVAGDLIDLTYVTDAGFLPNGTPDFDFMVEVFY